MEYSHAGIFKKQSLRSKRNKYEKIESDTRRKLLYMVKDLKISIKEAAQFLGINYSTSKTILQLYRRTGRIDRLERKYLLQLQLERQGEMGLPVFQSPMLSHQIQNQGIPFQVPTPGNSFLFGSTCQVGQASTQENLEPRQLSKSCYYTEENTPINLSCQSLYHIDSFGQNKQLMPNTSQNLNGLESEDQSVEDGGDHMTEKEIDFEGKKSFFDFSFYKPSIYKEQTSALLMSGQTQNVK